MATLKVPVTQTDHIRGNENAPLTLVEYGDYECRYCGAAHPVTRAVQRYFGEDMQFIFRHFPLREVHPHAQMAAQTAEMAGARGYFWEMHDLIFENQQRLSAATLAELVEALGLTSADLVDAFENPVYLAKVRGDFLSGVRSGVNGTPTFFVNGRRYNGPPELDDLIFAIEQFLPGRAVLP